MADNFYGTLKGIPIDYLVSAPLMAAGRANIALAQSMEEFVMQIGFVGGDPKNGTNNIVFNLERPYTDPDTNQVTTQTITVTCPLLGLVPIPALLVDNVTVDFTTTVDTSSSSTTATSATVTGSYKGGCFAMSGSVTASKNQMRSSNQSATYSFHVQADQQPATEGMGKLMDVMASCITPVPTTASK
ncbi:DUF2589 domain-containing protein [Undibacterium sp. Rencai35W]|uniref:DUF2589 domain-containing protein n=1 Tax=unclassified Undibacterium TaxID=2630295 RepID=UPI003BF078CA